jgi:SAM-dependent methyltransferase
MMPRPRTLRRWRRIAWSRHSILRALEYEAVAGLTLDGRSLDIGGGQDADYHGLLKVAGVLETLNIDPRRNPSHLSDLNRRLPFGDDEFDNVLSLNTFEHVFEEDVAISEALRILRPGGQFHFIVPFLYKVHGSPSDFHRHTADWWNAVIRRRGASRVIVDPLVWDQITSAYALWDKSRTLRKLVMLWSLVRDPLWWSAERLLNLQRRRIGLSQVLQDHPWSSADRLPETPRQHVTLCYAVGYYIHGQK